MNNTICVKIGKQYDYLPFKWGDDGDSLFVWHRSEWRQVYRSEIRRNGEYWFFFASLDPLKNRCHA